MFGVSAEKPGSDYRGYVRDNTGALVGVRVPEGSPVVKKRYYYLRDALGSVVAVTNDAGSVVRRHVYGDPYGEDVSNDTIVTGAPSNPYRFAGEYFDTETNVYKIGERYYDPALARWTQKDPMNQAFNPREANRYAYVGGDPVNRTDPSGLHACDQAGPHAPWGENSTCYGNGLDGINRCIGAGLQGLDYYAPCPRSPDESWKQSTASDVAVGILGCGVPTLVLRRLACVDPRDPSPLPLSP